MAENCEVKTLSIKIMVDVKAKKVVFAEVDEEFVNFIISLMSLPLSTATRVLLQNKKSAAGSLGSLYNSIESLDTQCFVNESYKDSLFKPRVTVTVPMLSLHELSVSECRVYRCHTCFQISNVGGNTSVCKKTQYEMSHTCGASKKPTLEIVRRGAFYIVTDSLEVKPMSVDLIMSHAKEIRNLESKQVQVGLQEGLAILKASMETSSVLTSVFLNNVKKEPCL